MQLLLPLASHVTSTTFIIQNAFCGFWCKLRTQGQKHVDFPSLFSFVPSGDKRRDSFPNAARVQHTLVTESKLALLATRQASRSREELLGQGIANLSGKPADRGDGGLLSQRTILLELEFFCTKGGGGVSGYCKLLGAGILCSYIGLVTMFL